MQGFGLDWMPSLASASGRSAGRGLVHLVAALVLASLAAVVVLLPKSNTPNSPSLMWRGTPGSRHGRMTLSDGRPSCGACIGYKASGSVPRGFVRGVIRTHEKELLQLRSLIYSLRGQAADWLRVDFVLVPTEPGSHETYRALKEELNVGFDDIMLLDLPDAFYSQANVEDPYKCTAQEREGYAAALGANATRQLCDSAMYVALAATDRALHDFVTTCRYCTHVVVTDGSNGYGPDFLAETLKQEKDIVVAGFTHDRGKISPKIEVGSVDLGAILLRPHVLEGGHRLILNSLPEGARAQEVHDADFWFVKGAIDSGYSVAVLEDQILMHHH